MLTRQAKTLNRQIRIALTFLDTTRHPVRNRLIFLLSARAGLRAREIAELKWSMVTDPEGWIDNVIRLINAAAKGNSGGIIPIAKQLRSAMCEWAEMNSPIVSEHHVIRTLRSSRTLCSSHREYVPRMVRSVGL